MQQAVEFALAHGWSDEAVAELERLLANKNMPAALTLVRAQDMRDPACQQLKALIVLAVVT